MIYNSKHYAIHINNYIPKTIEGTNGGTWDILVARRLAPSRSSRLAEVGSCIDYNIILYDKSYGTYVCFSYWSHRTSI